jgi:hypothetical protein
MVQPLHLALDATRLRHRYDYHQQRCTRATAGIAALRIIRS